MAEALFEEDGPLEQYLRDATQILIESHQSMPGTSHDILDALSSSSGLDWEQPLRFRRRRRQPLEDQDADDSEEEYDVVEGYTEEELEAMEWRPKFLIVGLNLLDSFVSSAKPPPTLNPFVEKFKYSVISSSLLSTTLSSSAHASVQQPQQHHTRGSPRSDDSTELPGKLALSPDHDQPSPKGSQEENASAAALHTSPAQTTPPHYAYLSLAALVASVVLSLERRWLATLSLGGLSFLAYNLFVGSLEETSSYDFSTTIHALDDLIEANRTWETIVQDALQYLEREDSSFSSSHPQSPSFSPRGHTLSPPHHRTRPSSHYTSPSLGSSSWTPSNALRIALHSTFQTTRNQCDNVRQLFSALTCPSEVSQLSEMYAPPSPMVKSPLLLPAETSALSGGGPVPPRPYSFPPRSTPSSPEATLNKRSTWSGPPPGTSYTGLAGLGSPTTPFRRRDRTSQYHRGAGANLSALFEAGSPTPSTGSVNTPVTPFQTLHLGGTQSLAQIAEDLHGGFGKEDSLEYPSHSFSDASIAEGEEEELFGSVVLDLHKTRKAEGMGVLGLESAFELPPPRVPPKSAAASVSSFRDQVRSPPPFTPRSPPGLFGRHSQYQTPYQQHRQLPLATPQRTSHTTPHRPISMSSSATFTSSSRFTSIQPPRHPLSLFALNQALQAALMSRRYTCSHLLALRFREEACLSSSTSSSSMDPSEHEEYWENVKSVVELLTTTFEGEAARLAEALEDVERQWGLDEIPTPNVSGDFSVGSSGQKKRRLGVRDGSFGEGDETTVEDDEDVIEQDEETTTRKEKKGRHRSTSFERVSFAPMPSHLSRFAAHVAAISSALQDARDQLEDVVAALKEDGSLANESSSGSISSTTSTSQAPTKPPASSLNSKKKSALSISVFPHANQALYGQLASSDSPSLPRPSSEDGEGEEHKALQAYERLRRELGMALRECERGRQRLVEIIHPPPALPSSDEEGEEGEGVPHLTHDTSDDSDKPELLEDESLFNSNAKDEGRVALITEFDSSHAPVGELTALLQQEQELALEGVEEVYEADTGLMGGFNRERSKLTREERIKAARERRERLGAIGGGLSPQAEDDGGAMNHSPPGRVGSGKVEKWGPGGEVVQELKDVIWQVAEKRRKMMENAQAKSAQQKGGQQKTQPLMQHSLPKLGQDEQITDGGGEPESLLPYV